MVRWLGSASGNSELYQAYVIDPNSPSELQAASNSVAITANSSTTQVSQVPTYINEGLALPGLTLPFLGAIAAARDGVGGYNVVVTLDGTTLPAIDVFTDGLATTPITVPVGGSLSPATTASVSASITGPTPCLLSVGGTCLVLLPVDPSNPTGGTMLGVQVCVQPTVGCVVRNIPV
jgi:hypothetical protein